MHNRPRCARALSVWPRTCPTSSSTCRTRPPPLATSGNRCVLCCSACEMQRGSAGVLHYKMYVCLVRASMVFDHQRSADKTALTLLALTGFTPGGGGRLAAGGGRCTAASGRGPCGRQRGGGQRTRSIRGACQPHRDGWQRCHASQCKWRSFHSGCLRQRHRIRLLGWT